MKFKKYFKSLFKKSSPEKSKVHHKRKVAIFWNKFLRILTIKFVALAGIILFLLYFGVANADAPIHALIDQMTKPKPISQAAQVLPADMQQAIEAQAQQEIKQEEVNALLGTNTSNTTGQST